jgi:predicted P-loop ATPase
LRDDYFAEVIEFDGQKGMEAVEGAWICEVAELLAMTKTKEQEAIKAYITRQSDRYRRPFDRRVTEYKRQCIFIGTTNKEQFLTDKTGGRRFYPVKVNQSGYDLFANEKEIRAEILQCWAEAKAKMEQGKMPAYADKSILDDIKSAQNAAQEDDYREGMITAYLESKVECCIMEIWVQALKNDFLKPSKKDSNDIALMLQSQGWESCERKRTAAYGQQRIWRRSEPLETKNAEALDEIDDELPLM